LIICVFENPAIATKLGTKASLRHRNIQPIIAPLNSLATAI
jgi:hypothetical protein